jgi:hypothetical protein
MKIYAHHDADGTIRSLVTVNAPERGGMMLAPKPGVFVAEIEGLTLKLKSDTSDIEALGEIARSHNVSTPLPTCRVAKKR